MRPTQALTSKSSKDGSAKYQSPNQLVPPGNNTYVKKGTTNHGGSAKPGKVN